MDQIIESKISSFIENQFPSFYQEEGKTFMDFVRAYYEWMEEEDNTIYTSRKIIDYKDIDTTIESFLVHFQKKYLYGIPFDVIINKRLLLKHVLDAYRSKGSIQCLKLLFRLIYNEDVTVYLPGRDVLRVSDGTWVEPKYLEITNTDNAKDFVGKRIYGITSKTTATVESHIQEFINSNEIISLYISNVYPKDGEFRRGETIIDDDLKNSSDIATIIAESPIIMGSVKNITVINGGKNFSKGDVLKVLNKSPESGNLISSGRGSLVRVKNVQKGKGSLEFVIENGGFGYTNAPKTFTYNGLSDTTGTGGNFDIDYITNARQITYNTDIIANYGNLTLDTVSWGFPANPLGNTSSAIEDILTFQTDIFGSIAALDNVNGGENYTDTAITFVKETINSKPLSGVVTYDTTNTIVTGIGTKFSALLTNNSLIGLLANTSDTSSVEYAVVKSITSNTKLELYAPPESNSTISSGYLISVDTLLSNYPETSEIFEDIFNLTANVYAYPSIGNNIISEFGILDSGKGYIEGETVQLAPYGILNTPTINDGGVGYSNNDTVVFHGSNALSYPVASITTDSNGTIIDISLTNKGSGLEKEPIIVVKSSTGSGANLTSTVQTFDTSQVVLGKIVKTGIGKQKGYFTTTRGFLNSDKYIQDSYYYQDFSYQINTAYTLDKYKDILYNTFHVAGTELFGKYQKNIIESSNVKILYVSTTPSFDANLAITITADATQTADSTYLTIDSDMITTDLI